VFIGNLDDRFGDDIEVEFDPELTFVAEGGVRYRIHPRIALEVGVTYVPLEATADMLRANDPRVPLPRTVAVDPLIVNVGAAWRF
jgi:outer membrane protein W